MTITILTLFPEMFGGPFDHSIIKRATDKGLVRLNIVNIRDAAADKRKTVDDRPYGGGVGMLVKVDVVDRALGQVLSKITSANKLVVLMDPGGKLFTQKQAQTYARLDELILICGHYEGVDERIRELVQEQVSIGDYVLTGGELPAMVVTDSVTRLIPGVLKKEQAVTGESFSTDPSMLEYPQYTAPAVYKKSRVPAVLMSGNHQKIQAWRRRMARRRTKQTRPDLGSNGKNQ